MGVNLILDFFLEVNLKIPTHSLISALLPFALFVACDKKKEEPPAPDAQEVAATEAQPAEGTEAKAAEGTEVKKAEEVKEEKK